MPGGVCISGQVYEVRNKIGLPLIGLENAPVKNVSTPVQDYRMVMPWDNVAESRIGTDAFVQQ